jgi:hypothetical protein
LHYSDNFNSITIGKLGIVPSILANHDAISRVANPFVLSTSSSRASKSQRSLTVEAALSRRFPFTNMITFFLRVLPEAF